MKFFKIPLQDAGDSMRALILNDRSLYCRGFKEGYDWATAQSEMDKQQERYWECNEIVWCPSEDWRYVDPRNVCEYGKSFKTSVQQPTIGSKGEWCKELK